MSTFLGKSTPKWQDKVKGVGSDGVEFSEQALTKEGGEIVYAEKEASSVLSNTIKFYDRDEDTEALKIDWQISVDGGAYSSFGKTHTTTFCRVV